MFGLQETLLTYSKSPSFHGFSILTKNSLNDRATGRVALLVNNSCLFSKVHLNTPLEVVTASVALFNVTLTVTTSKETTTKNKNRNKTRLAFSINKEEYNLPFSMTELKQPLQRENNSATGFDKVHYQLLTHLPNSALSVLLKVRI